MNRVWRPGDPPQPSEDFFIFTNCKRAIEVCKRFNVPTKHLVRFTVSDAEGLLSDEIRLVTLPKNVTPSNSST